MSIAIDVIFVLFMALMFFFGYRKGFLHKAWWLLDIAVIVLLGFFLTPTIKEALQSGTGIYTGLENAFKSMMGDGSVANYDASALAGLALEVIIWVALGILVIILMAILKCVLKSLTKYAFFGIINKILGGIYSLVIWFAVLMVLGVLAGTFTNFAPIKTAYDTCGETYIFKYIFGANPFQDFVNGKLPLGTWIGNLIN